MIVHRNEFLNKILFIAGKFHFFEIINSRWADSVEMYGIKIDAIDHDYGQK